MKIVFDQVRQTSDFIQNIEGVRAKLEELVNIKNADESYKRFSMFNNSLIRICLITGLSLNVERTAEEVRAMKLTGNSTHIFPSVFTFQDFEPLYSMLIKLRYQNMGLDLEEKATVSRIICREAERGCEYLLRDDNLTRILSFADSTSSRASSIPALQLEIGEYDENMPAKLDINGREVNNTQIIIAGATGSGKTNLLMVLINQLRALSVETPYPVNFLLFDYKGEFSDPASENWLRLMDVDSSALLNPIDAPLPFSPFKDFTGRPINEINLYSTEMASALLAIDRATISANMQDRLSTAIVEAYKKTAGKPITFKMMLDEYRTRMQGNNTDDSVTSVLNQLVKNNIFSDSDKVDLVDDSYIIDMHRYPKDGPIAKAIVYFTISKLNNIYEQLPKQETNESCVQIRHFTVIDEAHYMLDFDNRPLRNLIAVGRNKGMSIILATQDMASFKSKFFDYYTNAQYPLIMKQQTIDNNVLKDLFGATPKELQDIRAAIAGLQKGELIIKNQDAYLLGIGQKYKKIKITHLV